MSKEVIDEWRDTGLKLIESGGVVYLEHETTDHVLLSGPTSSFEIDRLTANALIEAGELLKEKIEGENQ